MLQEQKKKELDELNAMLAEMGVAPKESDADGTATAPTGKKKKKKDKAAVKENAATAVNGAAPAEQPKPEEPASEQTQEESIQVRTTCHGAAKLSCSGNCKHMLYCTCMQRAPVQQLLCW